MTVYLPPGSARCRYQRRMFVRCIQENEIAQDHAHADLPNIVVGHFGKRKTGYQQ